VDLPAEEDGAEPELEQVSADVGGQPQTEEQG
jgi:hypothetical protein